MVENGRLEPCGQSSFRALERGECSVLLQEWPVLCMKSDICMCKNGPFGWQRLQKSFPLVLLKLQNDNCWSGSVDFSPSCEE